MKPLTLQQHLRMANLLGATAKGASGEKQKGLKGLELAHRLVAKKRAKAYARKPPTPIKPGERQRGGGT
jgi:hypothetical protein